MEEVFNKILNELQGINKRLDSVDEKLNTFDERLSKLEEGQGVIKLAVYEVSETLNQVKSGLDERVEVIEADVSLLFNESLQNRRDIMRMKKQN